jgi:quinol monooxygenase YgiN
MVVSSLSFLVITTVVIVIFLTSRKGGEAGQDHLGNNVSITKKTTTAAMTTTTTTATSSGSNRNNGIFTLLVTLQFTTQEYQRQFLQDFAPLADHVRKEEPDTLAYEVLLPEKKEDNTKDDTDTTTLHTILLLERYRNKEVAYKQVHRSSVPFLQFRAKLQSMIDAGYVTLSGQSYFDAGIGFVGRKSKNWMRDEELGVEGGSV